MTSGAFPLWVEVCFQLNTFRAVLQKHAAHGAEKLEALRKSSEQHLTLIENNNKKPPHAAKMRSVWSGCRLMILLYVIILYLYLPKILHFSYILHFFQCIYKQFVAQQYEKVHKVLNEWTQILLLTAARAQQQALSELDNSFPLNWIAWQTVSLNVG